MTKALLVAGGVGSLGCLSKDAIEMIERQRDREAMAARLNAEHQRELAEQKAALEAQEAVIAEYASAQVRAWETLCTFLCERTHRCADLPPPAPSCAPECIDHQQEGNVSPRAAHDLHDRLRPLDCESFFRALGHCGEDRDCTRGLVCFMGRCIEPSLKRALVDGERE